MLPVILRMIADKIAERLGAPLQVTDDTDEDVRQDQERHAPIQDAAGFGVIPRLFHAVFYRQYLKSADDPLRIAMIRVRSASRANAERDLTHMYTGVSRQLLPT